jgi:hypothetical protein
MCIIKQSAGVKDLTMAALPRRRALDEITDFLASGPQPEAILNYKLSESTQRRALQLLEQSHQTNLSADEQMEIEDYRQIDHLMTLLKAKARLKLTGTK